MVIKKWRPSASADRVAVDAADLVDTVDTVSVAGTVAG